MKKTFKLFVIAIFLIVSFGTVKADLPFYQLLANQVTDPFLVTVECISTG